MLFKWIHKQTKTRATRIRVDYPLSEDEVAHILAYQCRYGDMPTTEAKIREEVVLFLVSIGSPRFVCEMPWDEFEGEDRDEFEAHLENVRAALAERK